jgi:hypothetical protein
MRLKEPWARKMPKNQNGGDRSVQLTPLAVIDARAAGMSKAVSRDSAMLSWLVSRIQLGTKLKAEWAHKCLSDNDFDYDQSLRAFLSLRAQIPPDAFMP